MKLKFSIVALLLILSSQTSFISAQQQQNVGALGTEKPLFRQTGKNTGNACYVYKKYVVMTVSSDNTGEDIKIYKRKNLTDARKECVENDRTPYMMLKNSGESYFFGLTGDKFLTDSGTSAGVRGLGIVGLTAKKIIFSTPYQGSVKVAGSAIVYDKPSDTKGSLKNCPNEQRWTKEGGSVGWVRPTRINLTTLRETSAGQLKCVYVE